MSTASVGVDMVRVDRIRESLRRSSDFEPTVFTRSERTWCNARPRRAEAYAMLFAIKEAVLKALGTGVWGGVALHDVEVRWDDRNQPQVDLGPAIHSAVAARSSAVTHVTVSCAEGLALAVAWVR